MSGYIGTKASVVSSGAERKKVFAITGATTSLTGLSYTPNQVHVFHNGVRLVDGTDYTATNGTSITLTTAAQNGDEVVVISYATFQTSDTVSASAGGTFSNDVAINGNLTVDTNTLFVDAASNSVGVGTTSPDVFSRGYSGTTVGISSASGESAFMINSSGTNVAALEIGRAGARETLIYDTSTTTQIGSVTSKPVLFITGGSERMRIDASGNLLVGTTSNFLADNGLRLSADNTARFTRENAQCFEVNRKSSDGDIVVFYRQTSSVGSISVTASATAYNTSSDYRLKEDVQPMVGSVDRLMALKPVNFAWKASGSRVDGFIAHEAQEVVPEAVHGSKDAMRTEEYEVTPAVEATYDDEGNILTEAVPAVMGTREVPEYQGIDQSKLVPLLTAALQEALTKIEQLEARMAILEGGAA